MFCKEKEIMKLSIKVLIFMLVFAFGAFAQTGAPVKVTALSMPADPVAGGEVAGSIKGGQVIPLRWAESSQVACFPGTRFEMFNGNTVFYRIAMPAASSMVITMTPKDGAALNLYALRQSSNPREQSVPPNVQSAISCEAKYPIYANLPGGRVAANKDDGIRKIEYVSAGSAYSILIGVAGAKGLTEGDFNLKVSIKPR